PDLPARKAVSPRRAAMRPPAVLLLAPALLAFAPAPKPKEGPKDDLKKLQGTWGVYRLDHASISKPDPSDRTWKVVVDGDQWSFYLGGVKSAVMKLTLDPKATPKALTLRDRRGVAHHGIYSVDGDVLKWSFFPDRPDERPTEFTPTTGQVTFT